MPQPDLTLILQVAGVLLVALSLVAAGHALLNKRDPRSALGWVALILFSPVIGIVAYFWLGVNRIRRRAQRLRKDRESPVQNLALVPGNIESLRRPFHADNHVECLLDGHSIIKSVREAVRGAQHRICLSVYIFESIGVGAWLIDELGNAAARGVKVRVLLDGVGALYSWGSTRKKLEKVGVKVGVFLKPRLIPPLLHINIRNHRKILVADSTVAIVGGTNVRNAYLLRPDKPDAAARDANFALRGPVVADVISVFADDWLSTTGENMEYDDWASGEVVLPPNAQCRVTVDGPDNDMDLLSLAYQAAMGRATRRIRIVTPYFLPPHELMAAMQLASVRGIRVEVVLPGTSNLPFVHWATRNMLLQLMRYGVHVFYQKGSFDHSKLLVVDDNYCLIGSANVDARSLRLNFEIGVEIDSTEVVSELNSHIDGCVDRSLELTVEELEKRSIPVRLRDAFAWLFVPYL